MHILYCYTCQPIELYTPKNLKNKNINIFNYQKYEPIQELETQVKGKVDWKGEECINLIVTLINTRVYCPVS